MAEFTQASSHGRYTGQLTFESLLFVLQRQTLVGIEKFERPVTITVELQQVGVVRPKRTGGECHQQNKLSYLTKGKVDG